MHTRGESWLHLDEELLRLWNYFADPGAAPTNTELLFIGAARPYFDFFVPQISHAVGGQSLESVQDRSWRDTIAGLKQRTRPMGDLRAEAKRVNHATTLIITSAARQLAEISEFEGVSTITVDDGQLLTNIEPAWRSLRLILNKRTFDTVLVNLGPIRAVLLPRLARVYNVRAIDVTPWSTLRAPQKPHFLRRVHRRLTRLIQRPR